MKYDCDIIRDLLPLYADKACSEKSRMAVEEHLAECPDCRGVVSLLLETELEDTLQSERESVIQYGAREFRRRTAAVGSVVSGSLMIPILIGFALYFLKGPTMSWISVVVAALFVPASLIVVPLTVREDKLFWTFCAFAASLLLLIGVTCRYSGGDWFWIASSGTLLGLSLIFTPFLVRAKPVKKLIGESNRLLIVLGVDAALFFNMLNAIESQGKVSFGSIMFSIGLVGGIVCVALGIYQNRKTGTDRGVRGTKDR